MSTERCPTVKIKADSKRGFVIINESDFDPGTMQRFDAPPAPKPRRGRRKTSDRQ